MGLDFEQRTAGGSTIVSVGGEIDLLTAPELRARAVEAIDDGATRLILDLTEVTFMDSSGLGALIAAHKRLRERDGNLLIVARERAVLSVLSLTGLDQVLELAPTVDEALERWRT